ncbi:MAG: SRPBCC family protein [Spirosomataceae bacterium]
MTNKPIKIAQRASTYHFVTNWQVAATPQEVYDIISQSSQLTRWWPSVYLDVKVLEEGNADGVGKLVELYTKGWLPYTLQWKFRVKNTHKPHGIEIEALGDFIGRGIWIFEGNGNGTSIIYDWKIEATKPILKKMSWLLKPAFSANHLWAMRKGEESLKLEIRRRNGERDVPIPPQPTFPHNLTDNKIL